MDVHSGNNVSLLRRHTMCFSSNLPHMSGHFMFLALLQVTDFWNKVLNEAERTRLVNNIAGHLKDAKQFLQKRAVSTV